MWVIRCRSAIINPWQNPAAVLYKMTTPQIPPPAFEYNQRTHASPPAWQHLHANLQTAAAVGMPCDSIPWVQATEARVGLLK